MELKIPQINRGGGGGGGGVFFLFIFIQKG
jgi:hypothetical protein